MTLLTDSELEQARRIYPTGLVRLHVLLDDLGQADPDRLLKPFPMTPLSWTVEHNASAEADTADITLDGSDFPFEPSILNAATVELYQADAGQLDSSGTFWTNALNPPVPSGRWKVETSPEQDNAARDQIVRDTVCLFMGVVDECELSFGDDGKVRLHLKCRDFTAYFLDAPPTKDEPSFKGGNGEGPDAAWSLKQIIEDIVSKRKKTKALQVVRWPEYDPPDPVYPALYDVRAKTPDNPAGKRRNKESIWSMVQELALEAGRIVIVHLDRILIIEPATIFTGAKRDVDRWLDQNGRPLKPVSFRFVLGFDLCSFTKRRLMGRRQATNVLCTVHDPTTRTTLTSLWIDPDNKATKSHLPATAPGTDPHSEDIERNPPPAITFTLRNVRSQKQLDEIARQLGEQIRNREIEAELETADMVDAEGQSLVGLRYGMPVYIDYRESLKQFAAFSPEVQMAQLIFGQREDGISPWAGPSVQAQELTDGLARAAKVVDAMNNLQLPFYLHRCTHRFDPDGGGYRFTAELRSRHQVVILDES